MGTPDSSQPTSESPSIQDSPYFNYISSLSPIEPMNVGNTAALTIPSPQVVFMSPHDNFPKKLKLIKRSRGLGLSGSADHSASLESTVIPSYQITPCTQKDTIENPPSDSSPSGKSSCVDEFLADPFNDSEISAASPCLQLKKAAELSQGTQSGCTTLDESCTAGVNSKNCSELPQRALDEMNTSNKQVKENSVENSKDVEYHKASVCTNSFDVNMDKVTGPAIGLRSALKVSPSMKGTTTDLDAYSSKQNGVDLSTESTNQIVIDQESLKEQLDSANIGAGKQTNDCAPSGPISEIEEKEVPDNQFALQTLSIVHEGKHFPDPDPSNENHSVSNFRCRTLEDAKLQLAQDQDCHLHAQPELILDLKEDKNLHDSAQTQPKVFSPNQILYSPEEQILQQRGMRKRLQFEAVDTSSVDKDENMPTFSSAEPPETPVGIENLSFACAESSATSTNRIQSKLAPFSGETLQRLRYHQPATPEAQKVDRSVKAKAKCTMVVCRQSGIGLHLNSIGAGVPNKCATNLKVSASDGIAQEENVFPGNKEPLASKPGSASLNIDSFVKSMAASKDQIALSSTKIEEGFVPEENQLLRCPDSSYYCETVVDAQPLKICQPSKPIDAITSRNMKTVPEIGSKIGESTLTSPKKKRKKGSDNDGCKRCKCRKSKCLKLYCDCFAAGSYCSEDCDCQDCFNKPEHQDVVLGTRQQIESRNPLAFAPKVVLRISEPKNSVDSMHVTPPSARHKRGCNCKKSQCLKKYCECFQAGVGCSLGCRCDGCKNTFGRKEGLTDMTELERKILHQEVEHKSPTDQELEENSTVGKLEYSELRSQVKSKESPSRSHLSPLTPLLQGPSENETSKNQFPANYYPSPDSSASVLASLLESPSSPRILSTLEAGEGSLCIVPFDNEQDRQVKVDPFSPGWNAFAEMCNLSPLDPPPSTGGTMSSKGSICKGLQTRLFQGSGTLSGGTLRWRSSPVTPKPHLGEGKFISQPDSDTFPRSTVEDDTPEVLMESQPRIGTVKATSPNQKRVSPPRKLLRGGGSSSLACVKNGRKFILQSVPSFPPLTPYSKITPQDRNP